MPLLVSQCTNAKCEIDLFFDKNFSVLSIDITSFSINFKTKNFFLFFLQILISLFPYVPLVRIKILDLLLSNVSNVASKQNVPLP